MIILSFFVGELLPLASNLQHFLYFHGFYRYNCKVVSSILHMCRISSTLIAQHSAVRGAHVVSCVNGGH